MTALADDEDHRIRGAFIFNGASATGRLSSLGLQVHNFPRKSLDNPENAIKALINKEDICPRYGKRVTDVLKGLLRPSIIPKRGCVLVSSDWSAIEARVNPWVSNEPQAKDLLDLFKQKADVYVKEAAGILQKDPAYITPEERQLGKVAILSLGYGGSTGAFSAMSKAYNINITESEVVRIINAWRKNNSWATTFWTKLTKAYTNAIRSENMDFSAGLVTYRKSKNTLWYILPSGRLLCYPKISVKEDGIYYAKSSWIPASSALVWPEARLWHGIAAENITQALANDILRHACKLLDDAGLNIVLTVHDEVVIECPAKSSDSVVDIVNKVMQTPPKWATGLPLHCETKVLTRYSK
jgi:DNA polymerase